MATKIKRLTEEERQKELTFTEGLKSFFEPQKTTSKSKKHTATRVSESETPTPKSVSENETRVSESETPTPKSVSENETPTPKSVSQNETRVSESETRVSESETQKGVGVSESETRVAFFETPIDPEKSPSAFWFKEKIDISLIGFWNVLLDILSTDGNTISIRPLAQRFGMDKSKLFRLLKRLEAAEMLTMIPQKEGTFIQVINPVSHFSQHEEEEGFKKQLPLPFGRDFKKAMELRDALEAIFWGCLAVGRDADELSGTTIDYLLELSQQRTAEYVSGILLKYIRNARSPLSFLQAVFAKEPDPLSAVEIAKGEEIIRGGEELFRNINRLDEYGLNGMRNYTKNYAGLDLGKNLESARTVLEALREKHNSFVSKWGQEEKHEYA